MPISSDREALRQQSAIPRTAISAPRSRPRAVNALKTLAQCHRWLGVTTCLFFAMWFLTGAVMLFVPFPDLSTQDRARSMIPIDIAQVLVRPGLAAAAVPSLRRLELIQGPQAPSYILFPASGPALSVSAVTGRPNSLLSANEARETAANFCRCRAASVVGPFEYDQWIVHQRFDPERPFYRVDLADPRSTSLYVSQRTGEILQRTNRRQRVFNYLGSVIHWIYPTMLRRFPKLWSWTVWAVSLVAITTGLAGFSLGILRTRSALRNTRKRNVTPFKGVLRWHHLLGLGGGVLLITWVTSGWLSVDHGLLFPTGDPTSIEIASYRGSTLSRAADKVSLATVRRLDGLATIDVSVVAGVPFLSGWAAGSGQERTWTVDGQDIRAVPSDNIVAAVRAAWPGTNPRMTPITPGDDYAHLLYDGIPGTSVRVKLGDPNGTWVHVDAATGEIVEVVDWRRRIYRWLFNGLHTFDVPGLEQHDLVRKVIMLPCLGAGFALSISGVVLGFRRIRKSVSQTKDRRLPANQ